MIGASTKSAIPIVSIVGPTGVGKTKIATKIAPELAAEIVSIDSMQVYKKMDIGTAKPTDEDKEQVRFHLVDVVEPWEPFSVADFKRLANSAIADITSRGKIPMLVGGSGLYYRAVVDDLDFPEPSAYSRFGDITRANLENLSDQEISLLLEKLDPKAAASIPPSNRRRRIRGLEIALSEGRLVSERQDSWLKFKSPYRLIAIGVEMSRPLLYKLIDSRVEEMIERGLVEETIALVNEGLDKTTTAGQSIGYNQIMDYLEGKLTLEEAIELIKKKSRNYAKRQMTWFRKDPRIRWFGRSDKIDETERALDETAEPIFEYAKRKLEGS